MVMTHALVTSSQSRCDWIVDSGATCHMSNDEAQFVNLRKLSTPQKVTLGDGHSLEATAEGAVKLEMLLPDKSTKECRLQCFASSQALV